MNIENCIECDGTGTVELRPLHSILQDAVTIECQKCKGKGQVEKHQNSALENAKEEFSRTILNALNKFLED